MEASGYAHDTFLSPFTWRYGSQRMREIWSEVHKRRLLRRVWVALATAQHEAGLVTAEQLADLKAHEEDIDITRAREIEAEIHHDLMAEVRVYAEQCPIGGRIIHLGATSMDISDNVDVLRMREALDLLLDELAELLRTLTTQIEQRAGQVCMGFTHLQPAEPTTVGYRLAQYAQDLWMEGPSAGPQYAQRQGDQGRGGHIGLLCCTSGGDRPLTSVFRAAGHGAA